MNEQLQTELAKDIASFTHDPLNFTRYAYAWGEGVLENAPGPRKWQEDVLKTIVSIQV